MNNIVQLDYNPVQSPLELPIQTWKVQCCFQHPVTLPLHSGTTPGTLLWGTFGTALWKALCQHIPAAKPCNIQVGADHCLSPQVCQVPWLYKPHSSIHHRQMTRPVLLYSPELESPNPVSCFSIEVTLWGRHAVSTTEGIEQTLFECGCSGFMINGRIHRFQIIQIEKKPVATLLERVKRYASHDWNTVNLQFVTPFVYREEKADAQGFTVATFEQGENLPLSNMIARAAYELAAWDIEDRETGEALDNTRRHALCRDTRDHARAAVAGLDIKDSILQPALKGKRYSRHNGHYFPLMGFTGQARIGGDITTALPWLLTLVLGGGGQKRSMGFGQIRMTAENR